MTDVAGTTESAPAEPDELRLAGEFDSPSREQWQKLVAGVLSKTGALPEGFDGDPATLLAAHSYDGLDIQPLYTAEDLAPPSGFPGIPPFVRGTRPEGLVRTGWDIRALHAHPDAATANRAILADLEGGVQSIWLRVGAEALPISALPEALNEVYLELAPVVLDAGPEYEAAAQALLDLHAERDIPASELAAGIGADPVGLRARTGEPHDIAPAAALAATLAGRYPKLCTLVADGLPVHEAGGSDGQELGAMIATGVAYLRGLTAAGLDVDAAAAQIEFRLAATGDQFLTIAKLRAARRLWARVTELSGVAASGRAMRQHAVASPAMLTRRDPWVNMLRGTLACFGAGVGGADSITVLPFDGALGRPDAFARRIARNTHAVLLEESKLAGVIDPAGGSWYVENLTDRLAHAAWTEFTSVEGQGGIEKALDSGWLAQRLERTWQARSRRLATRKEPITGVSEFANLTEKKLSREPEPSTSDAADRSAGLPRHRYAEDYETLRDRADAHAEASGRRPAVFLATLGPVAAHTARASFATNLFQAGGIEAVNPGATESTEDLVAAFRESGTAVACICGRDADYAEQADEVASALRAAGAESVLLAGKPAEEHSAVTGFVYSGCDALEVLAGIHTTLGVN